MSHIKYPPEQDYFEIFGGSLPFEFVMFILSQLNEVKELMKEVIAQLIHDLDLKIIPENRQDTEWHLAGRLLFREFGDNQLNAINWAIKCYLAKACHLILQSHEVFPPPGPNALVSLDEKGYEVKKGFNSYLRKIGQKNAFAIGRLMSLVIRGKPIKLDLEDVKICLSQEINEMFERGKDKISLENLNPPQEE